MFRFENPEFLIAYAIVPILLGLYYVMRWLRRRSAGQLASGTAWQRLIADWSGRMESLRIVLLLLAFAMLCTALANPQWGLRRETVQAKAADIFIALDISNSMLAEDIAPSRLDRAKRFAQEFVDAFKGDRIGLILFAGNAYLQMPLTNDYASAELFIRSADPRLASTQGTAIGDAIDLAIRAFEEDVDHQRALVIITDGENHEEGAIEQMTKGRQEGLVPFVVSVGTTEGALIPIEVRGQTDYKRDENGLPVRTSVNEDFLRQLARAGNGELYSILDAQQVIEDMRVKIEALEKREMEQRAFKEYRSFYQYFLFLGLLFLFT
jgi:Ca-activated chloride channel family protein